MLCGQCKKEIKQDEVKIFYKKFEKHFICPHCKIEYKLTRINVGLRQLSNGQLIRKQPKDKMTKKQRLKLRREALNA